MMGTMAIHSKEFVGGNCKTKQQAGLLLREAEMWTKVQVGFGESSE